MQIELVEESRHVVGVGIHLIAAPGLTRAPMPSPIVRDDAIAAHPEEEHLRVPGVGRERLPVRKDDWLSGSPILIGFSCRSACLAVTIESCRRRAPWSGRVTGPATRSEERRVGK